ncbi:hypothetical protein POM88_019204 [Heracleum sosnowskyi]|uniref:Uncharacterized protein n=1 Tax=Heracleum sosnowskyi TaxID=360622 RepID=A0AAD8ISS5_9APIA|nr:hypothetical protein POM88_019204 [Heracleum sosnowskyi]
MARVRIRAGSNSCCVFDSNDWFRSPSLKATEKCVYVIAKLSKLSRSNSGNWKNTSKRAGCETWARKGKQDRILNCEGNLIGEKRITHNSSKSAQLISSLVPKRLVKFRKVPVKRFTRKKKVQVKRSMRSKKNSYNNVEGTSNVTAENLTVLENDVGNENFCFGDLGSLDICLDDLGSSYFCFDNRGGEDICSSDLGDWGIDRIRECLDTNQQEEALQGSTRSKLGKRKFESEENLYQAKKMCLNPY